jgi:hypothetical protein
MFLIEHFRDVILDYSSFVHDDDAIGFMGEVDCVRDEDDGLTFFVEVGF